MFMGDSFKTMALPIYGRIVVCLLLLCMYVFLFAPWKFGPSWVHLAVLASTTISLGFLMWILAVFACFRPRLVLSQHLSAIGISCYSFHQWSKSILPLWNASQACTGFASRTGSVVPCLGSQCDALRMTACGHLRNQSMCIPELKKRQLELGLNSSKICYSVIAETRYIIQSHMIGDPFCPFCQAYKTT